ncbi:MAG: hypothetical protein H0X40_05330 [Chthoniobacterales bacterium]|nr:hypothetical protein [Chthoniobacterales bacterium]
MVMFGVVTSDDYQPVGWMGRYPIRITTIVVAAFVIGMFATVIALSAHWDVVTPFAFTTWSFWHGSVWQPITCVLIQGASFFFLFNIFFLYWSGVEVEKYLGRQRYLTLLALLLLVPPVFLTCWSAGGVHWTYYGSYEISVGMFIAFATLYPNVELFGWVTLKWLAFAGLVLASMQTLPNHEWGNLSVLWGMCLTSFIYLRLIGKQVPFELPAAVTGLFRRKPKFQVVPRESAPRTAEGEDIYDSIDPVLDKISKSGIGSLTASERRALDRARNRLLNKSS